MVKFSTYERFGVKEYWLVSPDDKTVEVFKLEEGSHPRYGRPEFYLEGQTIRCSVIDGLSINLSEVFIEE